MKKFTTKSSLKSILFSIFTASVIFAVASCEIGLGEAVDIEAPVVTVTSPEPTSAVPKEFTVEGSVSDNTAVKELTVTVSETGQQFKWNGEWTTLVNNNWVKYDNATFSGGQESFTWTLNLSVRGASSGDTFTILTTATDEAGNEGKQSKDERSITVDVNEPVVSIVSPLLESTYDSTRYGTNYKDGSILRNLINRNFTISGIQKEDTRLSKLYVLLDESTSTSIASYNDVPDISEIPHICIKEIDGSRSWSCDVTEAEITGNWEENEKNEKHFIRLVTESHDAAGNIERRVHGWFTYWNESDIPWLNVNFGDDQYIPAPENESDPKQTVVYPSCTLQGESYDDDGLKAIDIEVWLSQDAETEPTIRTINLDKHYDLTAQDYPTFYCWSFTAISEKKNFKISITATDKNGIKSETVTKYLGIANVNPPSITVNTPTALLGDANGNFTITGTIKDDGPLESNSLTIVRIANGQEASLVNYYTPTYQGWSAVTNGSRPYTVTIVQDSGEQPVGGYYTYTFTKTFNLFTDFNIGNGQTLKSQIFMFKVIDGDSTMEADKRSSTVTSITLQGDTDAPSLTIDKVTVKHSSGSSTEYLFTEGELPTLAPFATGDKIQYSGTWSDNSTSYWTGGKTHINNIQLTSTGVNLTASMNNNGTWTSNSVTPPADTFTATLNASLTDWGGNTTSKKASYYVSSSYPRLERITSLNADGSYKAGDVITIVLEYNKKVTFTGNGAKLTLNNGGEAVYDTSSNPLTNGTSKHYYKYTVLGANNDTEDLNVTTINPNGSEWKDIDGTSLQDSTALPLTNLANSRNIKIDKSPLSVSSITSIPSSGWYKADKEIIFNVTFNKDVKFSAWNSTRLKLKFAEDHEEEVTPSASSSKSLQFKYTVVAGDDTENLTALFDAKSCTVADYAGNSLTPQTSATSLSGLNIDTDPPAAPTISNTITDNEYIYSEEGKTFTVTSEEEDPTIYYSLDNVTDVNSRTWLDYPSTGVTLDSNGVYSVMAYQVDRAGNQSPKTTAKKVTVDIGNILTSITSSKPDGIYTTDDEIDITLKFRKPVKVSGSKLKLNVSAKDTDGNTVIRWAEPDSEPSTTAAESVTYKYTVSSGDSCTELSITEFTFTTIKDEHNIEISEYVNLPDEDSNNRLQDNRKLEILTGVPEVKTVAVSSDGKKLNINFSSAINKGEGNIKLKVKEGDYLAPAILSKTDWNGFDEGIQNYYKSGTNGWLSDTKKSDLTEKFILDWDTEPNDTTLIGLLKTAKADTVEIPIDSTAVTVTGTDKNILTVDITDAYKFPVKGVTYIITIPAKLVQNNLGGENVLSNDKTVYAPGIEKPVIRINKSNETITGTTVKQPTKADVRIDCQTPGVTIKYNDETKTSATKTLSRTQLPANGTPKVLNNDSATDIKTATAEGSISTSYNEVFKVGADNITNGYKILVASYAQKTVNGSVVKSEISYEYAQRTVVVFGDNVTKTGYDHRWIRGGDWTMGGVSTPDFPLSWDSKEYTKVRAMTKSGNNWYWISWNINTTAYVGFLAGDIPSNTTQGPSKWCWGSCAFVGLKEYYPVYPGESLTIGSDACGWGTIGGIGRGNYAYQDKHRESR